MFRLPKTSTTQSPIKKIPAVFSVSKNQGLCRFPHRKCNFVSLENYDYCLKHILEDKSAPYKPCPFLYTVSGKKCGKPAYRPERKDTWFCAEHNRKAHLQRQRALSRHAPPKSQEALLATLGHYAPPEKPVIEKEGEHEESPTRENSQVVNPFVDIDASQVNTRVSQVLDYVSDSDSDVDVAMLDSVWRAQDHESSDAESVDSQNEDPLKHAGTYTAEEVTIIIKDKMIRLQSLYIDQFRRLHHLLKERRRKYLHALKKEKETLCSIHDQEKTTAKDQKLYQKLKALNRYHKYYGEEAILHKKALERRAQATEGHMVRTSHKGKCAFTEGGVKCGAKTLPVTKYCRKHILEDTQQVLFRACGFKRDDHICQEPTLNVFEKATCVYHITLPAQPHGSLDKFETKEERKSQEIGQSSQNGVENSLVNIDSEDLSVHDLLKPMEENCVSKSEPMVPLEPSASVNDILSLTEVSPDPSPSEEVADKASSAENILISPCEFSDIKNKSISENMDVEINEKNLNTPTENSVKHENSSVDLVDIMTDVGVVEEVLEADQEVVETQEGDGPGQEAKQGHEERMQLDPGSETMHESR